MQVTGVHTLSPWQAANGHIGAVANGKYGGGQLQLSQPSHTQEQPQAKQQHERSQTHPEANWPPNRVLSHPPSIGVSLPNRAAPQRHVCSGQQRSDALCGPLPRSDAQQQKHAAGQQAAGDSAALSLVQPPSRQPSGAPVQHLASVTPGSLRETSCLLRCQQSIHSGLCLASHTESLHCAF